MHDKTPCCTATVISRDGLPDLHASVKQSLGEDVSSWVTLEVWACMYVHREQVLPAKDVRMLAACLLQKASTVLGSWICAQRKGCTLWKQAACTLEPAVPDGLVVHCTSHQEEKSHLRSMLRCVAQQSVWVKQSCVLTQIANAALSQRGCMSGGTFDNRAVDCLDGLPSKCASWDSPERLPCQELLDALGSCVHRPWAQPASLSAFQQTVSASSRALAVAANSR